MNNSIDDLKVVRVQLCNYLWKNRINVSLKEDKGFDFLLTRGRYQDLLYELSVKILCVFYDWIMKYMQLYAILDYWLVSFLICVYYLVGIFISYLRFFMLEVLANCGWNSVLCLFYLDYGLYVMHLSYSNDHDLVFALVLWIFSLLSSNYTTKTLEYLFYLIEFIEIMLACSYVV